MRLLHQAGFRYSWNLDAYFENNIGDGFIFCAYNIESEKMGKNIGKYSAEKYLPLSLIDLQFYGSKQSEGGKLDTYSFHPKSAQGNDDATSISRYERIAQAIDYQIRLGLNRIIIPNIYKECEELSDFLNIINKVNHYLGKKKLANCKYYMTIPICNNLIVNNELTEKLLICLTDMDINFDGYYIVCDSNPGYKKKVSDNFNYYYNLSRIFSVLKKQSFEIIYGYSNWDAIIFSALVDIDYISIGTYENLRSFNIKRYIENPTGGPSDGWYFSEKLLNFIKAQQLVNVRHNNCIDIIKNEKNIFSDIILGENYIWNTHKTDVHKNYLLSISRLLTEINSINNINERLEFVLSKINDARTLYAELEKKGVYLPDESGDYHLATWFSFLKSKTTNTH